MSNSLSLLLKQLRRFQLKLEKKVFEILEVQTTFIMEEEKSYKNQKEEISNYCIDHCFSKNERFNNIRKLNYRKFLFNLEPIEK